MRPQDCGSKNIKTHKKQEQRESEALRLPSSAPSRDAAAAIKLYDTQKSENSDFKSKSCRCIFTVLSKLLLVYSTEIFRRLSDGKTMTLQESEWIYVSMYT
ncbi:hypothetical protein GOODEAATRI_027914 [Goodea atripinnis]|uniref:Uncharacterized protein n=1 Tax=Goodea atripinnis TaxID=208336 RepID=A0ABV0NNV6_9TELE